MIRSLAPARNEPSILHRPHQIASKLGEGGMGAVYGARDTRLKREVAIKVLPESFANDPDRLARFTREAKALAALNHPNIAQVYGVEQNNGTAIVIELVEGSTLAVPQSLATAVDYARQIAEALEAAHEKGIIHRDLKPANLMITSEGVVKVLDFGLATAPSREGATESANSPTLTMTATQAGTMIGTAAYMSPEQAAGKALDRRSDIWSFGVVLWEMLTGAPLFAGETVSHPDPTAKHQVSLNGGISPVWRRDGKELYFIAADRRVMAVSVRQEGARLVIGTPAALFDSRIAQGNVVNFDVAPDGRFLIPVQHLETNVPFILVSKWQSALR